MGPTASHDSQGESGWSYVPLEASEVVPYLASYSYSAADFKTWRGAAGGAGFQEKAPCLDLRVLGHRELADHTWYAIACSLVFRSFGHSFYQIEWEVSRRLIQLREHLHDRAKSELGEEAYAQHFGVFHFARRGGPPGTSTRLNDWCNALAHCINSGRAPPVVVALTLHFLGAPCVEDREASDSSELETSANGESAAARELRLIVDSAGLAAGVPSPEQIRSPDCSTSDSLGIFLSPARLHRSPGTVSTDDALEVINLS